MNKEILIEYYKSDPYCVATYHGMENMTPESCAEDTWESIKNAEIYEYDFGYFTKDETLDFIPRLTGFFIKPEFRNKDTFDIFKTEVYSKMPKYFISVVLTDNTKLNNFLMRLGGTKMNIQNTEVNYFLFNKESI